MQSSYEVGELPENVPPPMNYREDSESHLFSSSHSLSLSGSAEASLF